LRFFQQVTVGSNTLAGSRSVGSPTLGDNVYVGAGAKVIGKVRVGSNVRIGANAVVVRDVPDNATVYAQSSMRVIEGPPQDNRFITFRDGAPYYFDDGKWMLVTDLNLGAPSGDASEH